MSEIISLSLCELAKRLKAKTIGAREAVQACLDRMEKVEPQIGAMLTIDGDNALRQAERMDAAGPDAAKPLWGVPVTVKDALSTRGVRTTAASRILENFVPFYDAWVVEKLKEAGAIILGKANLDEFAMGSATENSAFQKTRNPWNIARVPGGSSGGSAAAVASGECFASLGSDTGGSIRQPAGFCGCVGLKPTYGRVSRYGLFAFASSLDQVGPLARRVEDCAAMLGVIAGLDARDNTCADVPVPDYLAGLEGQQADKPLAGMKLGLPENFFGAGLSAEVRDVCVRAIDLACDLGAQTVPVQLPDPDLCSAVYYIIAMAEASSNLARYDGVRYGRRAAGISSLDDLYLQSRSQGFGQEVKRRIMLGSYILSSGYYDAYFRKAAQTRRLIHDQYQRELGKCDAIVMPIAPVTAWECGSHLDDPLQAYLLDAFTLPANLAGLPGLSLPAGKGGESGMPVGIQLIGKNFSEADLLRYGKILQDRLPEPGLPEPLN